MVMRWTADCCRAECCTAFFSYVFYPVHKRFQSRVVVVIAFSSTSHTPANQSNCHPFPWAGHSSYKRTTTVTVTKSFVSLAITSTEFYVLIERWFSIYTQFISLNCEWSMAEFIWRWKFFTLSSPTSYPSCCGRCWKLLFCFWKGYGIHVRRIECNFLIQLYQGDVIS